MTKKGSQTMDPIQRIREYFSEVDSHDIEGILSHCTDDIIFDNKTMDQPARGPEAVGELYRGVWSAFPDLTHEIYPVASASGDQVFVEGIVRGTMLGESGGHPPTGRSVECPFLTVFDLREGKIAEYRAYYDAADWNRQMIGDS
jgi:steroid delta-isomerase-like uncharacterized protein